MPNCHRTVVVEHRRSIIKTTTKITTTTTTTERTGTTTVDSDNDNEENEDEEDQGRQRVTPTTTPTTPTTTQTKDDSYLSQERDQSTPKQAQSVLPEKHEQGAAPQTSQHQKR
jgi:hypothetical protein